MLSWVGLYVLMILTIKIQELLSGSSLTLLPSCVTNLHDVIFHVKTDPAYFFLLEC